MRGRNSIPLIFIFIFLYTTAFSASQTKTIHPYETVNSTYKDNPIDIPVSAALAKHGLKLRNPCSDEVFIRRIYIDMIGTLPTPEEVKLFLRDENPEKRDILIDRLFERDEFADYWTMKWCDILRVKSEFPINLWPNGVQAYNRWIYESVRDNKPYDQFCLELLTSSGSNFRVPPVNFYRAVQGRDSSSIAKTAALTFMGARYEKWPADRQTGMAAFFSKVAYKKTTEWKEEIVYVNPEAIQPVKAVYPDGTTMQIPGDADPRVYFADWLISPDNKWFARCAVNRIWAWTMGQGIIEEPDDIRPDNPPACPELLAVLEKELVRSGYDLRHIMRLIFESRTYQQSSIPSNDESPGVEFAHYTVRQLDAEVLADALKWIGGKGEEYVSPIPEPYTYVPKKNSTVSLADGSITSAFLTMFGRPARDTGLMSERVSQPNETQRLYLLNSTDIQQIVQRSPLLQPYYASLRNDPAGCIDGIYLVILSRYPTQDERDTAMQYIRDGQRPRQSLCDLSWALINSKEFLNHH